MFPLKGVTERAVTLKLIPCLGLVFSGAPLSSLHRLLRTLGSSFRLGDMYSTLRVALSHLLSPYVGLFIFSSLLFLVAVVVSGVMSLPCTRFIFLRSNSSSNPFPPCVVRQVC
jgi:hypothetical protein